MSTILSSKENEVATTVDQQCFHCGETCSTDTIILEDKSFCCEGCKMVYEILHLNDLTQYYRLENQPGTTLRNQKKSKYEWLDDEEISKQLIDFQNENYTKITFSLPQIHCASCIWLLENLYKLKEGIVAVKVNFLKKQCFITYDHKQLSLRELVNLLTLIGYAPAINHNDLTDKSSTTPVDKSLYYKLGVAGFAFGNIMLLSFPEYLGLEDVVFKKWFNYLNIILSLPVVFYAGFPYLQSAWFGLRQGNFNIDVPLSLGILTLFSRSLYDILYLGQAGYLDSLAGLVFFLLIGRWFQQHTYHELSFERDYKSYFPITTTVLKGGKAIAVPLQKVKIGDILQIRHQELIPTDGILLKGKATIDYSFVTGEAALIHKNISEKLYAGGRQTGELIELQVTKKVNQSYLTQLWNEEAFQKNKDEGEASKLANTVGKYFTYAILIIAFTTLLYWLNKDITTAINAFTSVLIIACPCAVALSIPFTFGNLLHAFTRRGFNMKHTNVIEQIAEIDTIIFDKTGTLTPTKGLTLLYKGQPLNSYEQYIIATVANTSSHPISQAIATQLEFIQNDKIGKVHDFQEYIGQGIIGKVGINEVKIGSATFIGNIPKTYQSANVFISINKELKGCFELSTPYRKGIQKVLSYFKSFAKIELLSGDNDQQQRQLLTYFKKSELHFWQKPIDKLQYIKNLQTKGKRVMMIGDGLNDAGALKQSDVGIVLSENTNNFTPACDVIIDAKLFRQLPHYFKVLKQSIWLVYIAYALAFIYNAIGLSFAVQGLLSPVVAAILMPLSSVTVVLFGVLSSSWLAKRIDISKS